MDNNKSIINGIDVSECKNFYCGICEEENKIPRTIEHFTADCIFYPNCYYKQLKRLQQENEELKSLLDFEIQKREVFADKSIKYEFALEEIIDIAEKLITETPEYHSCYYKDECGDNCTPKKQSKVEYCCYENVDKILTIINEALNEQK